MKALPILIEDSPMLEYLATTMSEKSKKRFVSDYLDVHSVHRRRVSKKLRRVKEYKKGSGAE